MPKAAIFFFVILLSSTVTNSYGFISGDLTTNEVQNPLIFDSGIVEIDSNFFTENDFKRYLIFGNDLQNNDF